MDKAVTWLREQGLAGQAKRSDREATQGAVAVGHAEGAAAIVELRCETDFVAKADEFVDLAAALAELVAAKGDGAIAERSPTTSTTSRSTLKENISVGPGGPLRGPGRTAWSTPTSTCRPAGA